MTRPARLNSMSHMFTIKVLISKQPFSLSKVKELLCVVFAHPM